MKDYTAQILRAIRKYYGTTQIDFSKLLGVRQGTLSKLEAGKLELSALQWIELSGKYLLDPKALITGRIEAIGELEIRLHNGSRIGNFKVHKRYLQAMGSTVRTVFPFVQFLVHKVGPERAAEFFKAKKIDPDFFIIHVS